MRVSFLYITKSRTLSTQGSAAFLLLAQEKKKERTPIENDRFYPPPPPPTLYNACFPFSATAIPFGCMYVCTHALFAITDIYLLLLLLLLVTIWEGGGRRCCCWVLGYSIQCDSFSRFGSFFRVHACMHAVSSAFSYLSLSLLGYIASHNNNNNNNHHHHRGQFPPLPPIRTSVLARPCPSLFFLNAAKNDDGDGEVLVFFNGCARMDGLGVGIFTDLCSALPSPVSSPPPQNIRARWRPRRIEITALFPVNGLLDLDGLVAIALPPNVRG